MKIKIGKLTASFLSLLLIVSMLYTPVQASAEDELHIQADAAILVDADTGKILYAKNEDTALGIASMSKMMTEYLMFEAIKEKKITWEQKQTVSDFVHQVSIDNNLSNVPLEKDKTYTIRELYEAMAIYSANGATIAIAEAIAGSEAKFVKMMNEKAEELGMENYHFVNSSGLNNSDLKGMHPEGSGPDDENVMSARSTALLAARLMKDFPEVLDTTSITKKDFPGMNGEMKNWNWMLPGYLFEYEGVDGLKTGTTDYAGYCFTGTAQRSGFRIITVIMNAKNEAGAGSYNARFNETKRMMDYAFNNYSVKEIIPANYEVKKHASVPVLKGKEKSIGIHGKEPIKAAVKNGEEKMYKPKFVIDKKKLNKEGGLTAPVKKGTAVGTLELNYTGENDYGYLSNEFIPKSAVVTDQEVKKANWFILSMRGIGGFFGDMWHGITSTVKGWLN